MVQRVAQVVAQRLDLSCVMMMRQGNMRPTDCESTGPIASKPSLASCTDWHITSSRRGHTTVAITIPVATAVVVVRSNACWRHAVDAPTQRVGRQRASCRESRPQPDRTTTGAAETRAATMPVGLCMRRSAMPVVSVAVPMVVVVVVAAVMSVLVMMRAVMMLVLVVLPPMAQADRRGRGEGKRRAIPFSLACIAQTQSQMRRLGCTDQWGSRPKLWRLPRRRRGHSRCLGSQPRRGRCAASTQR